MVRSFSLLGSSQQARLVNLYTKRMPRPFRIVPHLIVGSSTNCCSTAYSRYLKMASLMSAKHTFPAALPERLANVALVTTQRHFYQGGNSSKAFDL